MLPDLVSMSVKVGYWIAFGMQARIVFRVLGQRAICGGGLQPLLGSTVLGGKEHCPQSWKTCTQTLLHRGAVWPCRGCLMFLDHVSSYANWDDNIYLIRL